LRFDFVQLGFQAKREIRRARHRQIVLDKPLGFNYPKLPVLLAIAAVRGAIGQFKPTTGIQVAHAAGAKEPLGSRFPFFHPDLG